MTRLETILVGAYRDLIVWKGRAALPVEGMGPGRNRMAVHNSRVRDAAGDVVDCDSPRWLGRAPLAGDAACNSRTYRELDQRGLAVPLRGSNWGRGRTVALRLTEAGKAKAAELLTKLPASAGTLTPAEPALAASQFWSKELMPTETLSRETEARPTSYGPATVPLPVAKPATTCPPVVATASGSVKPRRLAEVLEGLSAETIGVDTAYNETVATWIGGWEKLESAKAHVCDGAGSVTLADLAKRREAVHGGELSLAQDAVKLTGSYVVCEEARAADLKVHVENCEDALTTTETQIVEKLNEAGVSVQTQPAYPANVEAAKHTFTQRVRESADWKAANAKLTIARATHQASVEAVTAGRLQATKAEAYLASVVKRLAAV